jgi:hypothetical protein
VESGERRNRSGDRNGGEAAATSLLAKIGSILCVTSTRCRERLCLYNLLDGRSFTRGLHLRRPTVLVRNYSRSRNDRRRAPAEADASSKSDFLLDEDVEAPEVSPEASYGICFKRGPIRIAAWPRMQSTARA